MIGEGCLEYIIGSEIIMSAKTINIKTTVNSVFNYNNLKSLFSQ